MHHITRAQKKTLMPNLDSPSDGDSDFCLLKDPVEIVESVFESFFLRKFMLSKLEENDVLI